ncbi:MAG: sugar nucleotide-binding protein [Chloroflexota bacterium]
MKVLISGLNGTVAPVLADLLQQEGHTILAWDRAIVPSDDLLASRTFLETEKPAWFFHLANGSPEWTEVLGQQCYAQQTKFLFTSTVSVYSGKQVGPFSTDDQPEPDDDYGRYKYECEKRIQAVNPNALIARLGWQIGHTATGNQMVAHLYRIQEAEGQIEASVNWFPACAFLEDTAVALIEVMKTYQTGLFHLDGNPGLTFNEIARRLANIHPKLGPIVDTTDHVQNNRMLDNQMVMNPITNRLN